MLYVFFPSYIYPICIDSQVSLLFLNRFLFSSISYSATESHRNHLRKSFNRFLFGSINASMPSFVVVNSYPSLVTFLMLCLLVFYWKFISCVQRVSQLKFVCFFRSLQFIWFTWCFLFPYWDNRKPLTIQIWRENLFEWKIGKKGYSLMIVCASEREKENRNRIRTKRLCRITSVIKRFAGANCKRTEYIVTSTSMAHCHRESGKCERD